MANRLDGARGTWLPRALSYARRPLIAAAIGAVAGLIAGWTLYPATHSDSSSVTVVKTIHGKVTAVDSFGANICVQPKSGAQECGLAVLSQDDPRLTVGETVTVSVQSATQRDGSKATLFVVIDPPPSCGLHGTDGSAC